MSSLSGATASNVGHLSKELEIPFLVQKLPKEESKNQKISEEESENQMINGGTELSRYPPYSNDARCLESSINKRLSMLAPDAINYGTICIYKVPEKHRKRNPQAYTPRLVSIGPLHHGQSNLQGMEEYKLKYLSNFLHTFRVPLGLLSEFVNTQEKLVRGCYENTYISNLESFDVKLSEVILLDGVFMVELFLKNHFLEMREMGDIIFDNPWVSNDILHDLLLFENQLPLRFVSTMYNSFVYGNLKRFLDYPLSFNELVQEYLKNVGSTGILGLTQNLYSARHLVEFLTILHVPKKPTVENKLRQRYDWKQQGEQKPRRKLEFTYCATATELLAAGVKFECREGKIPFAVEFDKTHGDLKISQLIVNDSTETFFRNLIAFEQTGYESRYITSYVIVLDNLIDTRKDVDILVECGIVKNQLGTSDQVAEVFNNLYKEVVTDPKEFYFTEVCNDLNDYSKDILHKWRSSLVKWFGLLRREYFDTPWSIISFCAAVALLILTVMQTVCSFIQIV